MFVNPKTDSIVSFTQSTEKWTTLQCYSNYFAYTTFNTCQYDSGFFQLGGDSTCQMLIPDPDPQVLKFTVESRKPIPYKAEWHYAALVGLPEYSSVLVCGLKWDAGMLNPWCYNLIKNEWSYKRKLDDKNDSP